MTYLYVIGIDGDRPVKVGIAVNVPDRLRHLQTGNPRRLHVLAQFPGYRALEELVHGHFASRRMIGEWFDFGDLDPVAEVSTFVQRVRTSPSVVAEELAASRTGAPNTEPVRLLDGPAPTNTKDRLARVQGTLQGQPGMRQQDVARAAGMPLSTTVRCLTKLATTGLAWRDGNAYWFPGKDS